MSQSQTVRSFSEIDKSKLFPERRQNDRRRHSIRVAYSEAAPYLEKLYKMHRSPSAAMAAIGYTGSTANHWADSGSVPLVALLALKWETREVEEKTSTLDDVISSDELKWLAGALIKAEKYDLASRLTAILAKAAK